MTQTIHQVQINGRTIPVRSDQSILEAALAADLPFPHACRVGGCGSCRCRLTEGQVKELTETGYLLEAEELAQGTILACQSRPRSDLRIQVEMPEGARPAVHLTGRVVGQRALSPRTTELRLALDTPMAHQPGQAAEISLSSLPGVVRPYSMAPVPGQDPQAAQELVFWVRRAEGGQFSNHVADHSCLGDTVTLRGPIGSFWLRPASTSTPLLMVAGGTGLAPILAMLLAADEATRQRPLTLIVAARDQADRIGGPELAALQAQWRGPLLVRETLSREPANSDWAGARGRPTQWLEQDLVPGSQAYLCGTPGLIDACQQRLLELGLSPSQIWVDRFQPQAQAQAQTQSSSAPQAQGQTAQRKTAGLLDYAKYGLFHLLSLMAMSAILHGGNRLLWALPILLGTYVLGDLILGDDTDTPEFTRPGLLTAMLWLALPLLGMTALIAVWAVSPGDALGLGASLSSLTGLDLLSQKASEMGLLHQAAVLGVSMLMVGFVGTITAHELTHRTWDPVSMAVGRWLLAFSFDTSFAIEHVYGHHRYVSTTHDPATAPRGRTVYAHVLISTLRGNLSAWEIECKRLLRRGLPIWSHHNQFLKGHAMSLVLVLAAGLVGGWTGALFFVLMALLGKSLLEIVNYMEHYGLVRDPATPVQPRHSWNTNRRVSSWAMFNLTRHSHHHAQGEVPFQDLRPFQQAPMMITGYLGTMLLTLVPPLWSRLMAPKLAHWDAHYASPTEQVLAREAERRAQGR